MCFFRWRLFQVMESAAFPLTFIHELGRSLSAFERARLRNVCSEWSKMFAISAPSMDFKAAMFEAHRVTFNEATANHSSF